MRQDLIADIKSLPSDAIPKEVKEEDKNKKEEKRVVAINEIRSLINQPLSIEMPNSITPEGIYEIRSYLSNYPRYYSTPRDNSEDNDVIGKPFEWVWQNKRGNLPKRLAKWLKKYYEINISPETMAEIGNIARRHSDSKPEVYYFMIVDKVDWIASELGKGSEGSCWWGCEGSTGRKNYHDDSYVAKYLAEGGLAVKFYDKPTYLNADGIGRVWLLVEPLDQQWLVVFNGYWRGQGATMRLAKVIASFLGHSYRKISVMSRSNGGRFYINNATGYLIGNQMIIDKIHSNYESIGKKLDLPRVEPRYHCGGCGLVFNESSMLNRSGISGISIRYCLDCDRKMFDNCDGGSHRVLKAELQSVIQVYSSTTWNRRKYARIVTSTSEKIVKWCQDCIAGSYLCTCAVCNKQFYYTNGYTRSPYTVDGKDICSTACYRTCRKCQDCREKTLNEDIHGDALCTACEEEFESDVSLEFDLEPIITGRVSVNSVDEWGGCQCPECSMARDSAASQAIMNELNHEIPF